MVVQCDYQIDKGATLPISVFALLLAFRDNVQYLPTTYVFFKFCLYVM